jgi:hypothetical protein
MFGATPNSYRNGISAVNRANNASTETPNHIESGNTSREAEDEYVPPFLFLNPVWEQRPPCPPRENLHVSRGHQAQCTSHHTTIMNANANTQVILDLQTSNPTLDIDCPQRKTPKKSLIPALRG